MVVHLITALIQDAAAVFAFPEDSNCSVQFQQENIFSDSTGFNISQGTSYGNFSLQKYIVFGVS